MANNVSHSTVDRAYAVATITILYKNDSPDAPGLYFRELKETNEEIGAICKKPFSINLCCY